MTAEALRALQAELGWTNPTLARALGVARRTVEDWRGGRRPIEGPAELAVRLIACLHRRDFAGAAGLVERARAGRPQPGRRRKEPPP